MLDLLEEMNVYVVQFIFEQTYFEMVMFFNWYVVSFIVRILLKRQTQLFEVQIQCLHAKDTFAYIHTYIH